MSDKTIRLHDMQVAYRREGPANAPVAMLAHGILTSHRMWDGVAAQLAGRWQVLRYDLRGHGHSTATDPPYTLAGLAGDAVELLDALGIAKVHFIGSSLGGMIGQQLGARHGARFHSLTLANTSSMQGTPQAWDQRIALAQQKGLGPLAEPTLERWFTEDFFRRSPQRVAVVRDLLLATGLPGFVGCASAVRNLAQRELLPRIGIPTLVIAGDHDTATPLAEARELQQGIPGAELAILPAAHQSAVECPEQFAAAWTGFIARRAPACT